MPAGMSGVEMAKEGMVRIKKRIPPKVVSGGPVMENIVEEKMSTYRDTCTVTLSSGRRTLYRNDIRYNALRRNMFVSPLATEDFGSYDRIDLLAAACEKKPQSRFLTSIKRRSKNKHKERKGWQNIQ